MTTPKPDHQQYQHINQWQQIDWGGEECESNSYWTTTESTNDDSDSMINFQPSNDDDENQSPNDDDENQSSNDDDENQSSNNRHHNQMRICKKIRAEWPIFPSADLLA